MKIPQKPPSSSGLFKKLAESPKFSEILTSSIMPSRKKYLHWDKLRHKIPPKNLTHEEWWTGIKFTRLAKLRAINLKDLQGNSFKYSIPEFIQETLHKIDLGAGGTIAMPEPITNLHTKDKYLLKSLIEEAITSSQLEGAATTREVAKEMLKSGRSPRDNGEQMILNNFKTMQRIRTLKDQPLTLSLIFSVHKMVTEKTLEKPNAAGRFRLPDEPCVVGDDFGKIYHQPPKAKELEHRMQRMCEFANSTNSDQFIHPVIKAIILHFWLAYDHPFLDGNGRTARALFYWSMLNNGYWLFEFISISTILKNAPTSYAKSFLLTETDENDLTYFIVAQSNVITRAIEGLNNYIQRKTNEVKEAESRMSSIDGLNFRQIQLIRHALKHPGFKYTIQGHKISNSVVYQTARADLLSLVEKGILDQVKIGKALTFSPNVNLSDILLTLEKN